MLQKVGYQVNSDYQVVYLAHSSPSICSSGLSFTFRLALRISLDSALLLSIHHVMRDFSRHRGDCESLGTIEPERAALVLFAAVLYPGWRTGSAAAWLAPYFNALSCEL